MKETGKVQILTKLMVTTYCQHYKQLVVSVPVPFLTTYHRTDNNLISLFKLPVTLSFKKCWLSQLPLQSAVSIGELYRILS